MDGKIMWSNMPTFYMGGKHICISIVTIYMFSFYVEDRHDRPYPFLSLMNDCRNKNKYFLLKHGASDLLDK